MSLQLTAPPVDHGSMVAAGQTESAPITERKAPSESDLRATSDGEVPRLHKPGAAGSTPALATLPGTCAPKGDAHPGAGNPIATLLPAPEGLEVGDAIPNERWAQVPVDGAYGERYLVSDHGRIWSAHACRVMRAGTQSGGYLSVCLLDGSRPKRPRTFLVHRLVAKAFVPGEAPGLTVDHANSDRGDNRACNLRWMSRAENSGRSGEDREQASRRSSKAWQTRVRRGNDRGRWAPATDAYARDLFGDAVYVGLCKPLLAAILADLAPALDLERSIEGLRERGLVPDGQAQRALRAIRRQSAEGGAS